MSIPRNEEWQITLANMVAAAADEPFAWGTHDCCMWTSDVVKAISRDGVDIAAQWRGTYSDAAGAAAIIADFTGGGTLEDAMVILAQQYGLTEYPPAFAHRADIVLFDSDTGPALGVLTASGEAAFVSPDGLVMIQPADIRRSWRVSADPYSPGQIQPVT